MTGGGHNKFVPDSECKFETTSILGHFRVTNLSYDMLCGPIISDGEVKNGYKITGNDPDNILKINIYRLILHWQCAQNQALQIKMGEEICQDNFIYYVDDTSELSSVDQQKWIR